MRLKRERSGGVRVNGPRTGETNAALSRKEFTMSLLQKIEERSATVGVIGLGYVGLPLIIQFVKAGFTSFGFDVDPEKIRHLKEGKSYIKHIPTEAIRTLKSNGGFHATSDFSLLKKIDCIIICVPTPLNHNREPDLSFVLNSTRMIAKHLRKNQLVVLESTTYPGTTDEDMRKILEQGGMKAGRDFFLAFSPEREDPNNKDYSTSTIPKIVGGYTPACLNAADALYGKVVQKTVPVSSTRVAEAAKLLENIYRSVNIALVNELKVLFDRMHINIYEVIEAAKTKPFGFQAFYPGPGLGGHCIPIDPFYLTWKAREFDFHTKFIELAGEVNTSMPYYVVEKVVDALNKQGKIISRSKVLILGLSYKKDIDDTRESPSLKLIELLGQKGAQVDYNDPFIPRTKKMRMYDLMKSSVPLTKEALGQYDCVLIATDHSCYDYKMIVMNSALVVDTRNVVNGYHTLGTVVQA
jgi:UDP-N-acetyl-D-glucosamine dehydrogenase